MKTLTAWIICLVACSNYAYSQDMHFSQYFNAPLLLNPANTGFEPSSDWRLGANYRNQWASLTSNPYKTYSIWGDAQLFNERFENGWIGLGGCILRDVAGASQLASTKVNASIAYHQVVGMNGLLSLGFGLAWVNKSVDATKLTFDNQWNGKFFDITIPSGEPFAFSAVNYMDLSVGINYALFPTDNIYLNFGGSVQHLNKPKESFFSDPDYRQEVSERFSVFLNSSIKLNDMWILNPNVYYSSMANVSETVFGVNAQYNLSGDGNSQLIGGLYMRMNDSFIPMVGYQVNDFKLTINYDATISSLSSYNQSRGAYELSLVKTGLFNPNKKIKCPVITF